MRDELEHETGLESMSKAELQAEAEARGLSRAGSKAALLRRIEEHDGRAEDGPADEAREAPMTRTETDDEPVEPSEQPAPAAEAGQDAGGEPGAEAREGEDEDEREGESEGKGVDEDEHEAEGKGVAEDEGVDEDEGEADRTPAKRERGRTPAKGEISQVMRTAKDFLEQRAELPVESVSGVRATEDGFRVSVDVVELARVPPTTDVLATYEVDLADGEVSGFFRSNRYYRNQISRE